MHKEEFVCWLGLLDWDSGNAVRKAAIQAGVARWTVDAKTGKTAFEWVKQD